MSGMAAKPALSPAWLPVGLGVLLAGCGGAVPIEGCAPAAGIDVICDFAKPEDLAALPGTPWVLISELGNGADPGHIAALRTRDERVERLQAAAPGPAADSTFPRCGPEPESLKPRGFHLRAGQDGDHQLLIVNASDAVRVERYRVTGRGGEVPELRWEGCVTVPDDITPNDVAALPDGGFVVSHMFNPPRTWWHDVLFLLGLHTGHVARWQPQDGWRKVPGSDASFPNGIETDPDTGRIFVAATYGQDLTAVDADGDNRQRVDLPVQTDNLTWSPDGRLIAVGHTGVPILGTRACRDMGNTSCAFPFAVAAIDPETLGVETLYAHADSLIPGPSVGLIHNSWLYLGTFFGDRVSRVALPAKR